MSIVKKIKEEIQKAETKRKLIEQEATETVDEIVEVLNEIKGNGVVINLDGKPAIEVKREGGDLEVSLPGKSDEFESVLIVKSDESAVDKVRQAIIGGESWLRDVWRNVRKNEEKVSITLL